MNTAKTSPADAVTLLDALETDLALATSAARAREGAPAKGRGVAFRKLLLRWREAQAKFDANPQSLGETLLARSDIKADPRFDQIKQTVDNLPKLVPKFGGQLDQALVELKQQLASFWALRNSGATKRHDPQARATAESGKQKLVKALNHGPLSGETGRPLPDEMAKSLIAGFARNADIASAAVYQAGAGKHPEAVTAALDRIIPYNETGFKGQREKSIPRE
jgi:hypothetical protein